MARTEPAVFVAGGQIDERKYRNLRSPTLFIFLDESVLKAEVHIAVTELRCAGRRAVECDRCVDSELAVGDKTIVEFKRGQAADVSSRSFVPGENV